MADSLKQRTSKGVLWTFIDVVVRYGITFLVSIVLARLLSPVEYGLIGILTIFINLFNVIVDGGFTNAIIRKQAAKHIDYCTVFYTNIAISIALCISLYICAGPIASFFQQPDLRPLTQVMSFVVIINAFAIVPKAKLTKEINFKSQTTIAVIAAIASGIIGVVLAYLGYGVWALVWQQLSCQIINTVGLWIVVKWMPTLNFSTDSFKSLWDYGWKLLVSGVLGSLWTELYQIVIGKCYSTDSLGLYTRASQFSSLCSNNISTIIQKVSFPVLIKIQDDASRLKEIYKRIIKVTMLVTFVLLFGMAACSKSMIYVLIGEQWLECAPMLQILCVSMAFIPLHGINTIAIQVVGRSDITLKLNIYKCIVNTIPLIIGVYTNIYWMLASSILTNLICYFLNVIYLSKLINYTFVEQVKDITPSFLVALGVFGVTYSVSIFDINLYLMFVLQIIVGGVSFLAISKITKLYEFNLLLDFALKRK